MKAPHISSTPFLHHHCFRQPFPLCATDGVILHCPVAPRVLQEALDRGIQGVRGSVQGVRGAVGCVGSKARSAPDSVEPLNLE